MVFDALGQMWGTLLVNSMSLFCILVGMVGVCIKEKVAIILVGQQKKNNTEIPFNTESLRLMCKHHPH